MRVVYGEYSQVKAVQLDQPDGMLLLIRAMKNRRRCLLRVSVSGLETLYVYMAIEGKTDDRERGEHSPKTYNIRTSIDQIQSVWT